MTDEKKHDDKDRQKVSDEELEDVAGGATAIEYGLIAALKTNSNKSGEVCDGKDNDSRK
jgi:hypothetical protein